MRLLAPPVAAAALAPPAVAVAVDRSVGARVDALLAASPIGASTSLAVRDAATGVLLLARDEQRSVPPASNAKLATARAALDVLGPDHRFRTTIEAATAPDADGVVHGDLRLVGRGDPALAAADLAAMADELHASGVRRITGRVIGDDSWLDDTRWVDAWPERMRLRDTRALGALLIADRADGTRVPSADMPDPALHAARVLRDQLAERGIEVGAASATHRPGVDAPVVLASHDSAPLVDAVRYMLERSNATTSELLTRSVGRAATGTGTTAAGVAQIREAWPPDAPRVQVVDGSGLAPANRASTDAITRLLVASDTEPGDAPPLAQLMAVAGRTGTIRNRMTDPATVGRVQAKTGTLADTSALSGYLDRQDGRRLAFSIVMHPIERAALRDARALQDALVGALAIGELPG